MIRLKKDGQYFDIAPGETITTEWVSTVFNDEAEFNGSYTYPVKAPFTPRNNSLLNNAHLIENRSARYSTMVTIEIFGRPWKEAKLTFDVTPDGYEMNCLIDNAEFAKLIKEKLLPDAFVNYSEGVFTEFVYDRLSSNRQDTIYELMDRVHNPGKGSCVFISQKNDGLFGSFNGEGELPYSPSYSINYYTPAIDFLAYITQPANRKIAFYNPSYYLHWVLRKVCLYLGFEATGDFFTDPDTKTLIIDNTGFLDMADVFAADGCKLAPARHLPNIKMAEFFKVLRTTFKLAIYFDGNERKAYFNYAPQIIQNTDGVDITGYTEPGITIQSYVPSGYEIIQASDDDDALFKNFEYVKSYFIGDNKDPQKLTSFTGTLFMTDLKEERPGLGSTWRIPRKNQVGNGYTPSALGTDAYNEKGYGKNEFSFRLLNYRGSRLDSKGNQYFYATSDGKDSDGVEHPTALCLWLGGTNGLINRFLKKWLMFFLRTEEVEITAHLPGDLLLQLSPVKKLLFTTATRALIPAMINQISFEQSDVYTSRIAAKIKIYPIYNQAATDVKAFTEVVIGEIENPGKIYVKLRLDERHRDELKAGNIMIVFNIFQNGFLDFFSDEACTKPRSVSSLKVKLIYNYRGKNPRNWVVNQQFEVVASGSSYQIVHPLGIDLLP
jgi:hypothetical protein